MTYTLDMLQGTLTGITGLTRYPDGSPQSCVLEEENRIRTPVGEIVPQYRVAEYGGRQRKYRSSLDFHANGTIRSAALDHAMPLQTPLGVFKAELVTFYASGALRRLFPLNGQVNGFWSEKNEGDLAEILDFDLPVGKFSAKIINLHFYESGALKSVTLWPGQRITVATPAGPMLVRTGFSLHEDGSVRSVEPAGVVELDTPVGRVKAFDSEMLGMNADLNSVQFDPAGALTSLKTIHTGLRVLSAGRVETVVEPYEAASLIHFTGLRTVPMQIDFAEGAVSVVTRHTQRFDLAGHAFQTFDRARVVREACAGCTGCTGGDTACCSGKG